MRFTFEPIGVFHTAHQEVPRFWAISDLEGEIQIEERYREGLRHLQPGERIVVLFVFDRSRPFCAADLSQIPPTRDEPRGVFSICSPLRPNPLGMSVLEVIALDGCTIRVRNIDILDGTPILDIKPFKT